MQALTDVLTSPLFYLPALLLLIAGTVAGMLATRHSRRPAVAGLPVSGRGARGDQPTPITQRPTVTFADVAGIDEVVDELREVRDYLLDPARFRLLGAQMPRGVLLHGPPGTGKTLLAKALAGETDAAFYPLSGANFDEVYVGLGAARIRTLFERAAANPPAIIFIDELDAVGRRRATVATSGQQEREATLNQLLVALDGFDTTAGIVLVAATNRVDVLDPALLRPGRFDRRIAVALPDRAGRRQILTVHTRDKPLAPTVDLDHVAQRTAGLSGADLEAIINEAALLAGRHGATTIQPTHISEAIDRIIVGPARTSHVYDPAERCRIAYHEAGHAIAGAALPHADRVHKISLVARGHTGGYTAYLPSHDSAIVTRNQLLTRIVVLLAGQTAEQLAFGDPSTGAADDLHRATGLARRMITDYGMGPDLSHLAVAYRQTARNVTTPPPDTAAEIRVVLDTCRHTARDVITRNSAILDQLVTALLRHETLEGDQLAELLHTVSPLNPRRTSDQTASNANDRPPLDQVHDRRPKAPTSISSILTPNVELPDPCACLD